jgi:hypothetical protein
MREPLTNPGGMDNAGTVAHRALRSWIEDGGYRDADPRGRLELCTMNRCHPG